MPTATTAEEDSSSKMVQNYPHDFTKRLKTLRPYLSLQFGEMQGDFCKVQGGARRSRCAERGSKEEGGPNAQQLYSVS
jgi:hypothetical protein